LGFLTIHEDGKIVGYNVLAGGGMGVTPSAAKTFSCTCKASLLLFRPEDVIDIAVAIRRSTARLRKSIRSKSRAVKVHHSQHGL
jgi:sulfite reductase beta subunit-like hemoprotein